MTKKKVIFRVVFKTLITLVALFFIGLQTVNNYPSDNFKMFNFTRIKSGNLATALAYENTLVYDNSKASIKIVDGNPVITISEDTILYYNMGSLHYEPSKAVEKALNSDGENAKKLREYYDTQPFGLRYNFITESADGGMLTVNNAVFQIQKKLVLNGSTLMDAESINPGEQYVLAIKPGNTVAGKYTFNGPQTITLKGYYFFDAPNHHFSTEKNAYDPIDDVDTMFLAKMFITEWFGSFSTIFDFPELLIMNLFTMLAILGFLLSLPYWPYAIKMGVKRGGIWAIGALFSAPFVEVTEISMNGRVIDRHSDSISGEAANFIFAIAMFCVGLLLSFVYQYIVAIPSYLADIFRLIFRKYEDE